MDLKKPKSEIELGPQSTEEEVSVYPEPEHIDELGRKKVSAIKINPALTALIPNALRSRAKPTPKIKAKIVGVSSSTSASDSTQAIKAVVPEINVPGPKLSFRKPIPQPKPSQSQSNQTSSLQSSQPTIESKPITQKDDYDKFMEEMKALGAI